MSVSPATVRAARTAYLERIGREAAARRADRVRVAWVTSTGDIPLAQREHPAADPWGVVCCLGQDGITSTSSCNQIALRVTGKWCPWCHPGIPEPTE
jgi:hypothetical protein